MKKIIIIPFFIIIWQNFDNLFSFRLKYEARYI